MTKATSPHVQVNTENSFLTTSPVVVSMCRPAVFFYVFWWDELYLLVCGLKQLLNPAQMSVVVPTFPTFFQETDDPALNPTVVSGAVFPGLFSSTSLIFLSFTFNVHGNRNNIKTSCCSTLCSFVLFKTSLFHPTDPGKRLCIFRPSEPLHLHHGLILYLSSFSSET
jgi:hypothetical protein